MWHVKGVQVCYVGHIWYNIDNVSTCKSVVQVYHATNKPPEMCINPFLRR